MALAVHSRGVDVSGYRISTKSGDAGNPFQFVIRYSAGAASSPAHKDYASVEWKLCEKGEIEKYVALGYDFIANDEWTETRCTEGAGSGKEDGTAVLAFWQSRGLERGSSIYVSWDVKSQTSQMAGCREYLSAYQRALGDYYFVDLYGDDNALRYMLGAGVIRYGWRSMSDNYSDDGSFYMPGNNWAAEADKVAAVSPAHLWQSGNRAFNNQADEDIVLRLPVGSHLEQKQPVVSKPVTPAPPKPAPKPAQKPYVVKSGDSLWSIAAAELGSGSKYPVLAKLNNIKPPYVIHVGQSIKLR